MSTKKKTTKKKTTTQTKVKKSIDAINAEVESNRKHSTPTSKKKTQKKKVVKKKVAKKVENIQSKKKSKKKVTGGSQYVKNGNPKGGKRKGAGRKKGSTTKKTNEIANKLAADGELTPLEYLLGVLRETPEQLKAQHKAGKITSEEFIVKLEHMQKRKDNAAEKAAPYIHPRLSAIEANINKNAHEEWLALMENDDEG